MSTVIDLSQIAMPDVIETLDYETIFAEMLDELRARDDTFDALLESDPAYKILETAAYREVIIRQRINDAAKAVMLSSATGADLDNLAALFGVERAVIDPGDPDAIPPVDPTYEDDTSLRIRVQLALESFTVAGPVNAYKFHALSADSQVQDIGISNPSPGEILVTTLSTEGDGTADQDLLDIVSIAVSAEDVRPLSDSVTVQSATIVNYTVDATLTLFDGPDAETVRQTAENGVTAYCNNAQMIGRDITLSGLYAALHVSGVEGVTLTTPATDITITDTQAGYATAISVVVG